MLKILATLVAALVATAIAQPAAPPPQKPDVDVLQAAIAALQRQRNQAQDEAAGAQGQLGVALSKLEEAQKKLAELCKVEANKDAAQCK